MPTRARRLTASLALTLPMALALGMGAQQACAAPVVHTAHTALTASAGTTSARPDSSVGGSISRTEILSRAQSWVDEGVPYSESSYWTDANGTYRQDCSGFVSMAWHLSTSAVTSTLPGYATQLGSLDDLQPGDMIDNISTHVVLFRSWTDSSHTTANITEEPHTGTTARNTTYSRSELTSGGYLPYRYNNVVSDPTPPVASVSGVVAGSVVRGGVSLGASVSDAVGTVDEVQFLVDGVVVGSVSSAPWRVVWNTLTVPPGGHGVSVRARNSAGQWGGVSSVVQVVVEPSAAVSGAVVEPSGTTDVFTRAAGSGHLVDTYRDGVGWHVSDLTGGSLQTPAVAGRVAAVVQPNGNVDVVSVNASGGHVTNTWRDSAGWHVTDLTGSLGTPAASGTPTAVVQPNGNVDIITVNASGGHLTNTWFDGDWHVTDLTGSLGTPAATGTPTAVVQPNGNVDVVSVNASGGHVTNTWSDSTGWHVSDLTSSLGTPAATGTPTAVVQPNGNVDIITVNASGGHLTNTWFDGDWHVTDLTGSLGTPAASGTPAAVVQSNGNVDVLSVNASGGHVTNTWADSTGWHVTDLTGSLGTPAATGSPTAVAEANGNVDIVTAGASGGHVSNTWYDGTAWHVTDLTASLGTPTSA